EGAGHRGRREHHRWPAGGPHVRGPWHRVRHRRQGDRRFAVHGGGAAPGGGDGHPAVRRRV
ncbi:4-hydroxythreonine-4-phosphate dehydrogenase (EC 1.1.1.262), partial [Arthrobacter sp. DR-2P]